MCPLPVTWTAAAQAGELDKAVDYAQRAAERAEKQLAFEDAVGLYQRALQTLDLKERPDEGQRCEPLLSLGEAQSKAADTPNARDTLQRAAEMAKKLPAPAARGRAALGFAGPRWFEVGAVNEVAVGLLEEALGNPGRGR